MQKKILLIISFFVASSLVATGLQQQTKQLASTQEAVTANLKLISAKVSELVAQIKEKEKTVDMNNRKIKILAKPPVTIMVQGRISIEDLRKKQKDLEASRNRLQEEFTSVHDTLKDLLQLQNELGPKLDEIYKKLSKQEQSELMQNNDLGIFASNN